MKNAKDLKILITGGSKGLGRALAVAWSKRGAQVAVLGRGIQALRQLKSEYPAIQIIEGDVAKKHEIPYVASQTLTSLGGIDILINNASTLGPSSLKLLVDTDCEDFEAALQTNLLGPFRLTKALISPMVLGRSGIVVNISSDASIQNYPQWGAYGASKAALDHITRTLAEELPESGIRFYAIDPGDMDTELHRQAIPGSDPAGLRRPAESAELLIQFLENDAQPSGRFKL